VVPPDVEASTVQVGADPAMVGLLIVIVLPTQLTTIITRMLLVLVEIVQVTLVLRPVSPLVQLWSLAIVPVGPDQLSSKAAKTSAVVVETVQVTAVPDPVASQL
jgi:hypothetical protein